MQSGAGKETGFITLCSGRYRRESDSGAKDETKTEKDSLPQRCEWRYYAAMGGLALMLPLLLPKAVAADNWQVEGANGVLQVRGALTEVPVGWR